jgi:hypothetical protein
VDNAPPGVAVSDSVGGMRWEDLFTDLEGQLESEHSSEEADLRAEEERLRLARLGVRDRLLAVHNAGPELTERALRIYLRDGTRLMVTPTTFGRDWFVADLHGELRRERPCIVPVDAIASVSLSSAQVTASLDASPPDDKRQSLAARLGIGFLLRDLCRRRAPVQLQLAGVTVAGTLDRVGRDHCDLAVHDAGGVRRESTVFEVRMVRFSELMLVRL